MEGNPTGAKGVAEHLGADFRSAGGLEVVNLPGRPVQPDNITETILYLLRQICRKDVPALLAGDRRQFLSREVFSNGRGSRGVTLRQRWGSG